MIKDTQSTKRHFVGMCVYPRNCWLKAAFTRESYAAALLNVLYKLSNDARIIPVVSSQSTYVADGRKDRRTIGVTYQLR